LKKKELFICIELQKYYLCVLFHLNDKKMSAQKIVNISRKNAWEFLINLSNMATKAFLIYQVSARVTKKDRQTGVINPFPNLQKLVMRSVFLNSDYETKVHNQLVREGKDISEYEKGENSMPIEFVGKNKIAGIYKDKKVICFYPMPQKARIVSYFNDGIKVQKNALKGMDIFPKYYTPKNQGTEKTIEINKMYFENLKQFTINKVRYFITD
jgi:hypothetical protein